jgi:hypothetical protein
MGTGELSGRFPEACGEVAAGSWEGLGEWRAEQFGLGVEAVACAGCPPWEDSGVGDHVHHEWDCNVDLAEVAGFAMSFEVFARLSELYSFHFEEYLS